MDERVSSAWEDPWFRRLLAMLNLQLLLSDRREGRVSLLGDYIVGNLTYLIVYVVSCIVC